MSTEVSFTAILADIAAQLVEIRADLEQLGEDLERVRALYTASVAPESDPMSAP